MQSLPRYAVVLKTYTWDAFVHRQAERCQSAIGTGDFFISVDETNGSVGPIPFERVVRTNNSEIIGLGFADRFEQRALLWWNPDYAHYQFLECQPEYDYYIFVEYDAVVRENFDRIVEKAASLGADLIALPVRADKQEWNWTLPHQQVYSFDEIRGALLCISLYSQRALKVLAARRREMTTDKNVRYWPLSEVFVPTEIFRAGYNSHSLEDFGDVSHYDWFPPMLEDDLVTMTDPTFIHPVLDKQRYIRSLLNVTPTLRSFLFPGSDLYRGLKRFPESDYHSLLPAAIWRRFTLNFQDKLKRYWLRIHVR